LWSQFQRLGLGMYQHLISVSAIYVSLAGEGTLPSRFSPLHTFEHIGLDVMLLAFRPCASLILQILAMPLSDNLRQK